jgi:3-deoxy-manno-octulosonate cytidylyltransferase (CMP-KDO synthetase)
MNIIGIIPARMGSSRFPGKPLANISGKAMIYHVYMRSKMANVLNDVYIATCDKEIESYCIDNAMKVIMTKGTHERASDRAAEAMLKIERLTNKRVDIMVMIQGDEPMIFPEMISKSVAPMLKDKKINVVNLMARLNSQEEQEDPNKIKVVVDLEGFALYFSREPVPSWKKRAKKAIMYKQVCVIPFRRDFLIKFNKLTPTPLEIVESIDMLRVLEHGYKVKMVETEFLTYSVDTVEDLKYVEQLLSRDSLVYLYNQKTNRR